MGRGIRGVMQDKYLPSTYIRVNFYPLLIDVSSFIGILILTSIFISAVSYVFKVLNDIISH